jgi:hypothetical protein
MNLKCFVLLLRASCVALSCASLAASPCAHEVLICSYVTAAGSKVASPTSDHPLFCSLIAERARDWSGAPGECEPLMPETVQRLVRRGLGVNSYLVENPENRANLIVVYHWGWIKPVLSDDKTREEIFHNRVEMLGILNGRAFDYLSATDRTAVSLAIRDERFFAIVSAYDADDWTKNQNRSLLWRTHMSVPSDHVTSKNAAPILLSAGGSLFGRDTLGLRQISIDVAGVLRSDPDLGP